MRSSQALQLRFLVCRLFRYTLSDEITTGWRLWRHARANHATLEGRSLRAFAFSSVTGHILFQTDLFRSFLFVIRPSQRRIIIAILTQIHRILINLAHLIHQLDGPHLQLITTVMQVTILID